MKTAWALGIIIGGAFLPGVALANDGTIGFSSSASASVTVIIPPLQAGVEAFSQGAVGLWTLGSETGGLMLTLPRNMPSGQSASIAIYRTEGNAVDVSLSGKTGMSLIAQGASLHKGLVRQSYTLSSIATAGSQPVEVMVAAI